METKSKSIEAKLLEIQEEVGAIKKDQTNPHFKNTYYDINSLLEAIKPVFNKHKILILQPLSGGNMKTILFDTETDETFESEVTLPTNPDPQKMGAIISYFRRYSLTSMLALEAEDTDANDTSPVAQVTRNEDYPPQFNERTPLPDVVTGGGTTVVQETLCSECGNVMQYKTGTSKAGKPYKGMFCPNKGHTPIWM